MREPVNDCQMQRRNLIGNTDQVGGGRTLCAMRLRQQQQNDKLTH